MRTPSRSKDRILCRRVSRRICEVEVGGHAAHSTAWPAVAQRRSSKTAGGLAFRDKVINSELSTEAAYKRARTSLRHQMLIPILPAFNVKPCDIKGPALASGLASRRHIRINLP